MEISLFLAKIMGLFLIVDGLVALIRYKDLMPAVYELKNNKFTMVFMGLLVLVLGLLVTVSHNIWTGSAFQIVITIFGWAMVIKGLIISIMPIEFVEKLIMKVNRPTYYKISGVVMILIGLWLSVAGFTL